MRDASRTQGLWGWFLGVASAYRGMGRIPEMLLFERGVGSLCLSQRALIVVALRIVHEALNPYLVDSAGV